MADISKKFTIAAFDFDGTIVKRDTFIDFAINSRGIGRLFLAVMNNFPVLLFCFFEAGPCDVAKERLFLDLFKGISADEFNKICEDYSLKRLPKIINKEALGKIEWHRRMGHKLVIVSASMENWIKPWAIKNGFEKVIATIPEIKNGILTGRFKTKNCNYEEKARRFLEEYSDRKNYYLYAYGDSHKDRQIFNIADEKFFRKF